MFKVRYIGGDAGRRLTVVGFPNHPPEYSSVPVYGSIEDARLEPAEAIECRMEHYKLETLRLPAGTGGGTRDLYLYVIEGTSLFHALEAQLFL